MDKVIRVIQGANGVLTCDQRVPSKLDFRPNNMVGRGKKERREKKRGGGGGGGGGGDRTGDSRQIKKKSVSPRKEFPVETGNREFRQTPRGSSSPILVIFYLKGCVVVSCPKGGVWLHFEPREVTLF